MQNYNPIDSLVEEIKGTSRIIEKVAFLRLNIVLVIVILGVIITARLLLG